jgi:membrane peptidoglycan carboxypeptidase
VRLLELAGAYGVFANGGQRVPPVSILKVTDTSGVLLDQYAGPHPQPVVDAVHAYLITSILSDNQARTPAFGPNSPLKLSRPAAVKTGTTDDFRDNWTLGYTSQLVTGVWVGNADNAPMRGTTGITGAAPIWHDFMEEALKPLPVDPLPAPSGIERVAIARTTGALWTEDCADVRVEEVFAPGTAPKQRCVPTPASGIPTPAGAGTPGTPIGTGTPAATAGTGTPGSSGASGSSAATGAPATTGTPGTRAAAPTSMPQPQPTTRPPAGGAAATAGDQSKKPAATPDQRDRRPRQERR